jgi:NADH-quinone oxidoreductase subunit C
MLEELTDAPALKAVAESLAGRFGGAILETTFEKKELAFRIGTEDLLPVLEYLKNELGFGALNDIIGLDRFPPPGEERKRFAVLYQLYNFPKALRVRIAVDVGEGETVPSIVGLYRSADWAEREIFDMFGLRFHGHPDLRRIYLPDEFVGHPLRKDFPLEG